MNAWLGIASTVIAIAGVLGIALGVLVASRAKTVIELQKENITTMEKRDDLKEKELIALRPRIKELEERVNVLQEMVTSAAKVDALALLTNQIHEETMATLQILLIRTADKA